MRYSTCNILIFSFICYCNIIKVRHRSVVTNAMSDVAGNTVPSSSSSSSAASYAFDNATFNTSAREVPPGASSAISGSDIPTAVSTASKTTVPMDAREVVRKMTQLL